MPILVENKIDCTGCSACESVCPKHCISLKRDEQWFPYPTVDMERCINCEACVKVCPVLCNASIGNGKHSVYAAWSRNSNIRFTSTSGGVFSELAYGIIKKGGYIVGAAYTDDNMVQHIITSNAQDVEKVRQSKYIQSDISGVFIQIREYLVHGNTVLFCGAPCQVAGLKKYLKKDYENLYTTDFICRGMNSPKAYRYWLDELEDRFSSNGVKVWFKYKENGWKKSPYCTRIDFENGKHYIAFAEDNYFMKGYLQGNLYLRPSCSDCRFKGTERNSDITLADFWKVNGMLDDDKGTSMVMINSKKGENLFNLVKDSLVYHERSFEEIVEGNVCFTDSVKINPKSEQFLNALGTKPFSLLVKEYTAIPISKVISRKSKSLVKKIIKKIMAFIK